MSPKIRVAILGSTGSIGTQALEVLNNARNTHVVTRLATGSNQQLLTDQAKAWDLDSSKAQVTANNADILEEFASADDVDVVVNGVVGFAGFSATIAAIKANKVLGLANKESMIAGGPVVNRLLSDPNYSGKIIPVDSEHSAIWQCLRAGRSEEVDELVLTASGGPFRGKTAEQMKSVTKEQALNHPTWSMGPKITIDSATLMNKGLEVIEAHALFGFSFDHIKVVIHPQSIVHSMVTFRDGATIAQLSHPDMRLPISLALGIDERLDQSFGKISFTENMQLDFQVPDYEVFPALNLAYEAGRAGQGAPAILSAANEIAVQAFLDEKIEFNVITEIVNDVLQEGIVKVDTEMEVYEADRLARERAERYVEKRSR